jgi:hypothetical protein
MLSEEPVRVGSALAGFDLGLDEPKVLDLAS